MNVNIDICRRINPDHFTYSIVIKEGGEREVYTSGQNEFETAEKAAAAAARSLEDIIRRR
jgi:hypothetical protein